jgi:hypothetical protein
VLADGYRFYQRRHARRILRATMYPAIVIFGAIFVVGSAHDSGSFPVTLAGIYVVAALVVVGWCERVVVRTGLQECPEGFVNRSNFGSQLLRLQDVARFESRKTVTIDRVYAVRRDGSAAPIQGLAEGQPIVWDGGESREIVGVLNERLEARRVAGAARGA